MVCLALSVNLTSCRSQNRGFQSRLPHIFPSADALRNPITVQKSHGPIVMITAVRCGLIIYLKKARLNVSGTFEVIRVPMSLFVLHSRVQPTWKGGLGKKCVALLRPARRAPAIARNCAAHRCLRAIPSAPLTAPRADIRTVHDIDDMSFY